MKPTHTIRVLLTDGRCQRHYVEAAKDGGSLSFKDYLYNTLDDEIIGWQIDQSFYNFDEVIGVQIEPFKGIVVAVDGVFVVIEEAQDLHIAVEAQIGARLKEIQALKGYLERLTNVRPDVKHAGSSCDTGAARPEGVDQEDARPNP